MKKILLLITALFISMNVFSSNKYYNIVDYIKEDSSPDHWEVMSRSIDETYYKLKYFTDSQHRYVECNAGFCFLKAFILMDGFGSKYGSKFGKTISSVFSEISYLCGSINNPYIDIDMELFSGHFLSGQHLDSEHLDSESYNAPFEKITIFEEFCRQELNKLYRKNEF